MDSLVLTSKNTFVCLAPNHQTSWPDGSIYMIYLQDVIEISTAYMSHCYSPLNPGCLIGIPIYMVYDFFSPHNWVGFHPLKKT